MHTFTCSGYKYLHNKDNVYSENVMRRQFPDLLILLVKKYNKQFLIYFDIASEAMAF